MAPRAFERPATIAVPGDGPVLDGLHVPARDGRGGAVIAPPHPLYGGSMESPVVTEIAHGCERAGFESLRFNWRGVGASQGEMTADEGVAVADYAASLDWIEDSVEGPIAACGYSFGAAAAARVASKRPRVRRLLLVAPPPALLDRGSLESFGGHTLVVAGDRDAVSPVAELESIVSLLPHASLKVVDGTDHFFMTSLRELGHLVRGFLGRGE